jgi:hypothetical protein
MVNEAAWRLMRGMMVVALGGAIAAACGGHVVIDGAPSLGAGGGGPSASSSSTTASGTPVGTGGAPAVTSGSGAGAGGSAGSGIQTPTNGGAACQQDYYNIIKTLEDALGCTPTAEGLIQCTGMVQMHDPCGCLHVINDAHPPPNFLGMGVDSAWTQCVKDGCCGPSVNAGCTQCPPPPTVGKCDSFTSQCLGG